MFRYYSLSPAPMSTVSTPRIVRNNTPVDPFMTAAPAGPFNTARASTYTEFVLNFVDDALNYTSNVDDDVFPRNRDFLPMDINPNDPQHSFGSPGMRIHKIDHGNDSEASTVIISCGETPASQLPSPVPQGTPHTSSPPSSSRKRAASHLVSHPEDDTDSEIELFPTKPRKWQKVNRLEGDEHDGGSGSNNSGSSHSLSFRSFSRSPALPVSSSPSPSEPDSDNESVQQPTVAQTNLRRSERILDGNNPEHAQLIAAATKVGVKYYDSDADDLPGPIKGINKSHLFRNVAWGAYAKDKSNDADFPTSPSFRQFVPGRFERLANGSAADQKAKLIVKLTDGNGKKHIYANPPPRDWNNQEAISALNKRTVQQIRRTTTVQFRARVPEYIAIERQWLLANLTAGRPTHGWKRLVTDFNKQFAGKLTPGITVPRPLRTQSSLSKEISRFGAEFYAKGLVPVLAKKVKKEQQK